MASRLFLRMRARKTIRALNRAGFAITELWYDLKHSDSESRELSRLLLGVDLEDEKNRVRDVLSVLEKPYADVEVE